MKFGDKIKVGGSHYAIVVSFKFIEESGFTGFVYLKHKRNVIWKSVSVKSVQFEIVSCIADKYDFTMSDYNIVVSENGKLFVTTT